MQKQILFQIATISVCTVKVASEIQGPKYFKFKTP